MSRCSRCGGVEVAERDGAHCLMCGHVAYRAAHHEKRGHLVHSHSISFHHEKQKAVFDER